MMNELRVVAQIIARPGAEGPVRDALTTLATASRGEAGCLSYELFESAAVPGTFITVESWQDQQHMDAHLQSAHVADALSTASEHLAAPPAIHPLTPVEP